MPTADYRCENRDITQPGLICGRIHERMFDGTPPDEIKARCCDIETDGDGDYAWTNDTLAYRVWGPVAIGQVPGAGGSPAR